MDVVYCAVWNQHLNTIQIMLFSRNFWPEKQGSPNVCKILKTHTDQKISCRFNNYIYIYIERERERERALRYKPAGRRFDSRCCHWNFSFT